MLLQANKPRTKQRVRLSYRIAVQDAKMMILNPVLSNT